MMIGVIVIALLGILSLALVAIPVLLRASKAQRESAEDIPEGAAPAYDDATRRVDQVWDRVTEDLEWLRTGQR